MFLWIMSPNALDLLSDMDMKMMFENGMRGGFSGGLGKRYVEAKKNILKKKVKVIQTCYSKTILVCSNEIQNQMKFVDCKYLTGPLSH